MTVNRGTPRPAHPQQRPAPQPAQQQQQQQAASTAEQQPTKDVIPTRADSREASAGSSDASYMVRIEHPETGKHFAVSEEDYHSKPMTSLDGQTYEEAGYEIVSYEDGTAYEEGAEPTKWAVDNTGTVEIGTEGEEDVIDPTSEARRRRPDGETDDAEA